MVKLFKLLNNYNIFLTFTGYTVAQTSPLVLPTTPDAAVVVRRLLSVAVVAAVAAVALLTSAVFKHAAIRT